MKQLLFGLLATVVLIEPVFTNNAAEAGANCTTEAGVTVNLVGNFDHTFEIVDAGGNLVVDSKRLGRDAMGGEGRINAIKCDEVFSTDNAVALRLGHKNDLLYLIGFQRDDAGTIIKARLLAYLPRDHELVASVLSKHPNDKSGTDEQFGGNFGKKDDVRVRYCWNARQGQWYSNAISGAKINWRGPFTECDQVVSDMNTNLFVVQNLALYPGGVPSVVNQPEQLTPVAAQLVPADMRVHCVNPNYSGTQKRDFREQGADCGEAQALVEQTANAFECSANFGANWSHSHNEPVDNGKCRW